MITFDTKTKDVFDQLCSDGSFLRCYDYVKSLDLNLFCEVNAGIALFFDDAVNHIVSIGPEYHFNKLFCYVVKDNDGEMVFNGVVDSHFVEAVKD